MRWARRRSAGSAAAVLEDGPVREGMGRCPEGWAAWLVQRLMSTAVGRLRGFAG